jgi:raffinose/stachyose/melibiose transport system substrate-binding protein
MFWWAMLSLRIGGGDALAQAAIDGSFDSEPFIKAAEELQRLAEMEPFQPGFLAAPWDGAGGEASVIANREAAMHLMGQWAPGTQRANSPDGEGLGSDLGWFAFPAVEGGLGDAYDVYGGGNGFAVGKDAPPEAVDFLRYISSDEVARRLGETGTALTVTISAVDSITDPDLVSVLDSRAKAKFVQLYLDQAFAPQVGAAINDGVQALLAGTMTPEELCDSVAAAFAASAG